MSTGAETVKHPSVLSGSGAGALRIPVAARETMLVFGILALQAAIFSASWQSFFCGDSIYYLSRLVEPARLRYLFTHYDAQGAYRPLTYVVFTWLLYPLSGLSPFGYHLAITGFAGLNSLLIYRLLHSAVALRPALIALFFFAVHTVQFYVSYDVTFLPDLTMMFCWLMALLAYSHYVLSGSRLGYAASLLWFAAAFLCKETALMLPVSVAAWHWILLRRRAADSTSAHASMSLRSVAAVLPFFACTALFLKWTLYVKHGLLYPGGIYGFTLRAGDLWPKLKYAGWILNFPDDHAVAAWQLWLWAALALPAALLACYGIVRAWRTSKSELLACGAWAAAALAPVLVVVQSPMEHNVYVPLAALALAFGIALDAGKADSSPTSARRPFILRKTLWALALTGLTASVWLQARAAVHDSWVGRGSQITKAALDSMQEYYPQLPRGAIVYLLPTTVRGNVAWYFDGGGLFQVFYRDPALRMLFADSGHPLPADFATRADVFILRFAGDRLFDVTADYKAEHLTSAFRLLDHFDSAAITVDPSEPYADFSHFDTPGGRPAFLHLVQGATGARESLVTLAGARVSFALPSSIGRDRYQLVASVVPALPVGDGMEARIVLESGAKRQVLFTRHVRPGDRWYDVSVEVPAQGAGAARLVLECSSGPARDLTGDWLAWSRLLLAPK